VAPEILEREVDLIVTALVVFRMNTRGTTRTDHASAPAPAYGPIDALLGYVVFYIFVQRATPTVVDVLTGALPELTPSQVRLGLAVVLWFILVVTVVDQVRRQLAAFGVGSPDDVDRAERQGSLLTESQVATYLAVLVVGGLLAAWTFERAVASGIALIRIAGSLDVSAFAPLDFATMIVFFVSFAGATRALDRLVVGGIRKLS